MLLPLRKKLNTDTLNWQQVSSFRFAILQVSQLFRGAVIQGDDTPEGHPSLLNGEPEEKSMLPNLEAFISGECLPDSIDVYFNYISYEIRMSCLDSGTWKRFIERHPVRFVRKYPPLTQADEGTSEPIVSFRCM
jgi:hypothetical protein